MTKNWRKSSYSSNGGEACVETAGADGAVLVRDTTNRDGAMLRISVDVWRAFTANVRHG